MSDRRKKARVAAERTVLVWCETWGEFFSRYAGDVSTGGMFILAEGNDLPTTGERFELRLALPEGHELTLQAKVVHVVKPAGRDAQQAPAGIGVEFVGVSEDTQRALHRLVEFSRQRGHEGSVSTSYAGWLFDYAAPLPLDEVVETIEEQKRPRQPSGTMPRVELEQPMVREEPPPAETSSEASAELKARLDLQLGAALQHLAHDRTYETSVVLKEILAQDLAHVEARKWTFILNARDMIEAGRGAMAAVYFKKVLELDAQNLEAKKYLAEHEKNKRLEALPFGHLFVKRQK
jgi:uncharacterized protein (TIGR02266 family)